MWSSDVRLTGWRTLVVVLPALPLGVARAADLAALRAVPQREQSAEQARRDRYECHNWALARVGSAPARVDPADEADHRRRAERTERVIASAGIGGALGSLVGAASAGNPAAGALSGAAVGAAVGALSGGARKDDGAQLEDDDYVRALSACLEGRGYTVVTGKGDDTEV
jgi:uncharacterized membrane protein